MGAVGGGSRSGPREDCDHGRRAALFRVRGLWTRLGGDLPPRRVPSPDDHRGLPVSQPRESERRQRRLPRAGEHQAERCVDPPSRGRGSFGPWEPEHQQPVGPSGPAVKASREVVEYARDRLQAGYDLGMPGRGSGRRCLESTSGRRWQSDSFRGLASICLTAVAALTLWLPVASANNRYTLAHRHGTAHVKWSGYHGVKFGEPLSAAARRLHGSVKSDEPRSPALSLEYPGLVAVLGSLRWEASGELRSPYRSGPNVGSFEAFSGRVRFPHRTFVGESLGRFRRSLGKGARPERPEHSAAIGYYLVGPHGRTLWGWGARSTGVFVIGIAESLGGAEIDWGYEG